MRYAVDWDARLQILGGASAGVVAMPQAMSRYHFKAELIIDAAFAQAMSVVIVCNGMTALAMAHYMKGALGLDFIPPNGFFVGARSVQLASSKQGDWTVMLSGDIRCNVRTGGRRLLTTSAGASLHRNDFEKDIYQFETCKSIKGCCKWEDLQPDIPMVMTQVECKEKRHWRHWIWDRFCYLVGKHPQIHIRASKSFLGEDVFQEKN